MKLRRCQGITPCPNKPTAEMELRVLMLDGSVKVHVRPVCLPCAKALINQANASGKLSKVSVEKEIRNETKQSR